MSVTVSNERPPLPAATASLVLLNFVVYGAIVLGAAVRGPDAAVRWYASLGLVPAAIGWYTPLTYSFLHASVPHVSVNMLLLWVFGCPLEAALGARRFLLAYLVAGIPAGLLQGFLGARFPGADPYTLIIGASGTVSALAGIYTVRFYRDRVSLPGLPSRMPAVLPIGLVAAAEMAAMVGVFVLKRTDLGAGSAHVAHVSGFALGLVFAQVVRLDRRARDDYRLADARAEIRQGTPFKAVQRWKRAADAAPADGLVLRELARACLAAGDGDEAEKSFVRAVAVLLSAGNKRDAVACYLEVVETGRAGALPSAARLAVSAALDEQGRHQEAMEVLDQLIRDDPTGADTEMAELRRASIRYRGLADPAGAAGMVKGFLEAHPSGPWSDYARQLLRDIESGGAGMGE